MRGLKSREPSWMEMRKSVEVQVDRDFALLLPSGAFQIKNMEPRHRLQTVGFLCLVLAFAGIIIFGYYCPEQVCALTKREAVPFDVGFTSSFDDSLGKPLYQASGLSYDDLLKDDFQFNMNAHDVMVFLHIQKTGGTSFGKHLVQDLDLKRPCDCKQMRKRCHCFRPHRNENWLFSRYSTGWKCGLHADWTSLTSCVDQELDKSEKVAVKRRYFYVTLLREPLVRYLSEFRHVQRGATWKTARHWCLGRPATASELPPCYFGENWIGVNLDDFISCDSNLAINRQTRMMSDLSLIECYNKSSMLPHDRDRIMLASAKRNLASMSYFGLTEYQKISQYIFEETFNLRFTIPFEQHNSTVSRSTWKHLTPNQKDIVRELNALDTELYDFAKKLLFQRFEKLKAKDVNFDERFKNLGVVSGRATEFNWDHNLDEGI